MRIPRFWGIHAEPTKTTNWTLAVLPFIIFITLYLLGSYLRLQVDAQDRLLPSVSKMIYTMKDMIFVEDIRSGNYLFLADTVSSLRRITIGMSLSGLAGLLLGINMGLFPGLRALMLALVTFASIIPPLAIMPILLVVFGIDELAKVVLIFIGTFFLITRDIYNATEKIPKEQVVKALTLGASQLEVVYKVVMPQIMPRLIDAIRLSLGSAWLFLIAAEVIASTEGLGYRIFLMRRYMTMDIIIPYVLWITFLGFVMDWSLRFLISRRYSWYQAK